MEMRGRFVLPLTKVRHIDWLENRKFAIVLLEEMKCLPSNCLEQWDVDLVIRGRNGSFVTPSLANPTFSSSLKRTSLWIANPTSSPIWRGYRVGKGLKLQDGFSAVNVYV